MPRARVQGILVVEMNAGQSWNTCGWRSGQRLPLRFSAGAGGIVPLPDEIAREIQHMMAVVGSPKS